MHRIALKRHGEFSITRQSRRAAVFRRSTPGSIFRQASIRAYPLPQLISDDWARLPGPRLSPPWRPKRRGDTAPTPRRTIAASARGPSSIAGAARPAARTVLASPADMSALGPPQGRKSKRSKIADLAAADVQSLTRTIRTALTDRPAVELHAKIARTADFIVDELLWTWRARPKPRSDLPGKSAIVLRSFGRL